MIRHIREFIIVLTIGLATIWIGACLTELLIVISEGTL